MIASLATAVLQLCSCAWPDPPQQHLKAATTACLLGLLLLLSLSTLFCKISKGMFKTTLMHIIAKQLVRKEILILGEYIFIERF